MIKKVAQNIFISTLVLAFGRLLVSTDAGAAEVPMRVSGSYQLTRHLCENRLAPLIRDAKSLDNFLIVLKSMLANATYLAVPDQLINYRGADVSLLWTERRIRTIEAPNESERARKERVKAFLEMMKKGDVTGDSIHLAHLYVGLDKVLSTLSSAVFFSMKDREFGGTIDPETFKMWIQHEAHVTEPHLQNISESWAALSPAGRTEFLNWFGELFYDEVQNHYSTMIRFDTPDRKASVTVERMLPDFQTSWDDYQAATGSTDIREYHRVIALKVLKLFSIEDDATPAVAPVALPEPSRSPLGDFYLSLLKLLK